MPDGGYGAPKAGFWPRFAALLIDFLIYGVMLVPAFVTLAAGPTEWEPCRVEDDERVVGSSQPNNAICEVPTTGTIAGSVALGVAALVGMLLYVSQLEGKSGQSLGARAVGIRVVDIQTGQPIGSGRAIGRFFASIISRIPCWLGYFWMLWDPQRQTWHDKMTSAVVVRT